MMGVKGAALQLSKVRRGADAPTEESGVLRWPLAKARVLALGGVLGSRAGRWRKFPFIWSLIKIFEFRRRKWSKSFSAARSFGQMFTYIIHLVEEEDVVHADEFLS